MRRQLLPWCFVLAVLLGVNGTAAAEMVRFHFTPAQMCGYQATNLKVGADGATGEWKTWALSPVKQPYYCQLKATHIVTFRHPATNQNVSVPLALPLGTPQMTYQSSAIIYTYTQYTIRVEFLTDGAVDVIYNSGIFRPLQP